jgi:hypothetical protein
VQPNATIGSFGFAHRDPHRNKELTVIKNRGLQSHCQRRLRARNLNAVRPGSGERGRSR